MRTMGQVSHFQWLKERFSRSKQLSLVRLTRQVARLEFQGRPLEDRDPRQRAYLRELEIVEAKLGVELRELENMKLEGRVAPAGILDKVKIALFGWARGESLR